MSKPFGKWSNRFLQNVRGWAFTYLVSLPEDQFKSLLDSVQMERAARKVYFEAIVKQLNQGTKMIRMFETQKEIPSK